MRATLLALLLALAVAALAVLLDADPSDERTVPAARQQFDRSDVPWRSPELDPDNLRGF